MPAISIVIPNFNGARFLESCLASLLRQTRPPAEIIIVDNASTDGSPGLARALAPQAIILRQEKNLGFAAAANLGVRAARSPYVAVLNNDTEAAPDLISACESAIERYPRAAFLACRILDFADRRRIDSAGDCFLRAGIGYRRGHGMRDGGEYGSDIEVFAACGAAAVYHRAKFQEAGGYDESFFAYLEDVDLGLRLRAMGCRGYYVPAAAVYHHGGGTSGGEFSPLSVRLRTRNALLLLRRNYPVRFLWRCLPMIKLSQLFWLARVLRHGRFLSYLQGLAGALSGPRARRLPEPAAHRLWQEILRSEEMARRDFTMFPGRHPSSFLRWYFRLFNAGGGR